MIHYSIFSQFADLLAFTTTKDDLSDPLPRFSGKHNHKAEKNRQELAQKLNIRPDSIVLSEQCHSANISQVDSMPAKQLSETDALVSRSSEICLCIQTADCVPVLLYDPVNRVIAAAHAGWRGTFEGITRKTVEIMINTYSCKPQNIYAVIGPSIGPEVYETGDEVAALFIEKFNSDDAVVIRKPSGRYHLDLWKANELQLLSMGIPSSQIENTGLCSFTKGDQFFSARREGIETGRMVSGIMICR
jgi:polyphenol oxidase